MTPEQIDHLIEQAGLKDDLHVFPYVIEVGNGYELEPNSYSALAKLLDFYGDARAAQERSRIDDLVSHYPYPSGGAPDEQRGAYIMRDYLAHAIRALT